MGEALTRSTASLPGFKLCLSATVLYLSLVVLLPLAALFGKAATLSPGQLWDIASDPRVLASLRVTFGCGLLAALIDTAIGLLVAWVLVRYPFPGRRILDALVDLPFALPTAVAGITLVTLFAPRGLLGAWLEPMGIHVAFSPLGITLALAFIGLPLVVRSVQPVLQELDPDVEEAAACLGAGRLTTFRRVIFPQIAPALITGFTLAFARVLGEYGSVVFIAGNMPFKTEVLPLLIMTKLEQFDVAGATALGGLTLLLSFGFLLAINLFKHRMDREDG